MGQDDTAVVNHQLKVHGIKNLRVIDASIMPNITSGNTNAPAVMIAEKCADMLLQDAGVKTTLPQGLSERSKQRKVQKGAAVATV